MRHFSLRVITGDTLCKTTSWLNAMAQNSVPALEPLLRGRRKMGNISATHGGLSYISTTSTVVPVPRFTLTAAASITILRKASKGLRPAHKAITSGSSTSRASCVAANKRLGR